MTARVWAAALVVALIGLPACGSSQSSAGAAANTQTLTVFAAASLKGVFTSLAQQFEQAHPHTRVTFNFAGSADLVSQLQQGAPADVLAVADTTNMAKASTDRLLAGTPVVFAANTLQIAVPPDNPARVRSLRDLGRPQVKVVVCAPQVPCGTAAQKLQAVAGVRLHPVSEEQSVTDVLNKVESGEADAGLVYVTDIRAAGAAVLGIRIPQAAKVVNRYPIAAVSSSKHSALARDFVALVTGAEGRRVLRDAGFAGP